MDVEAWLGQTTQQLETAGIGTARLDCLVLLEDVTGKDRAWLLAHPEHALGADEIGVLNTYIAQRKQHIPLAYIRGRSEFYGRDFLVDPRVLEPRPETETIIEMLLKLVLPDQPLLVDVGTGSGALAITAKLEIPAATVYGTDIDPGCLAVARQNASALAADINWLEADLAEPLLITTAQASLDKIDVIITNLPYVPDNFQINLAASHEPRLAIFGGTDGLDLYRRLCGQLSQLPPSRRPTYLLAESLPPQHPGLAEIFAAVGYRQTAEQDFVQLFTKHAAAPTAVEPALA